VQVTEGAKVKILSPSPESQEQQLPKLSYHRCSTTKSDGRLFCFQISKFVLYFSIFCLVCYYSNITADVIDTTWDDPYIQDCIGKIGIVDSNFSNPFDESIEKEIQKWWIQLPDDAGFVAFPANVLEIESKKEERPDWWPVTTINDVVVANLTLIELRNMIRNGEGINIVIRKVDNKKSLQEYMKNKTDLLPTSMSTSSKIPYLPRVQERLQGKFYTTFGECRSISGLYYSALSKPDSR